MVTVWLDECVQPNIITVTISAADRFLMFMINLLLNKCSTGGFWYSASSAIGGEMLTGG
ncbi:hypothetical protein D3C81_2086440 [compost metagenome]